jgi:hypothetical protein
LRSLPGVKCPRIPEKRRPHLHVHRRQKHVESEGSEKTGPAAKLGGAAQRKELLKELGESENGSLLRACLWTWTPAGKHRKMPAAAKKEEDFSEQIRQNRDKIEAARKEMLDKQREIREAAEGRERDFRIDLEWREKELEKKLAEMGSDEYKLTPYDPEKARAVFAEALAVREMRDRRAKGEKPGPVDLRTRMQELGKDAAVARRRPSPATRPSAPCSPSARRRMPPSCPP